MLYSVTHEETGRVTTYPDSASYEAAWDWFEASEEPALIAWYEAWDAAKHGQEYHTIWADEARTVLAPDWPDIVTAAYAWTNF
ncbi:MAG: hypothetical protein U1E70_22185 [Acetobacteraceae bacterium]|nr:hypothetical protein [Pseudomonadota bacterium]